MMTLFFIFALVAVCVACSFLKTSLRIWTGAVAATLLAFTLVGEPGWISLTLGWLVFAAVAFPLNYLPWRRAFISAPVMKAFEGMTPEISETEQIALDAGTVGFEGELFTGKPNWKKLLSRPLPELTVEEQAFIDGPCEELCGMIDEWEFTHYRVGISDEAWEHLKKNKFFGMIIPKDYGGLGFSATAHRAVLEKVGGMSSTVGSVVAVPNSLGPAELLLHYGTDEQKNHYLPRLASGEEIPCFGLTSTTAGSDATSIADYGVICKGEWEGKEVLGMRLTFDKRYITLAPVATVVGLAFRLYDPEGLIGETEDIGISLALLPRDVEGMEIGRRHFPLNNPFPNGPIRGKDVFVPLDFLLGGTKYAGQGWRMLVESLSVGRAISLPSSTSGGAKLACLATGAYARIRKQFGLPIGRFEGVEEALARIAANTYSTSALSRQTAAAVDAGEKPSVPGALAKYHCTELSREVLKDAMDIHGGKGIILGPRNYLGRGWQGAPIWITVEGANILTRSLMIFGQGALRCHPYLYDELQAIQDEDQERGFKNFEQLFFKHAGHSLGNISRGMVHGLSGARLAEIPANADSFSAPWYRLITRYSAVLASFSDIAFALLGGDLKRREMVSARLGDLHSHLLISCAILKYHATLPRDEANDAHATYALRRSLSQAHQAIEDFCRNFGYFGVARLLKGLFFPLGRPCLAHKPSDELIRTLGEQIMSPSSVRDALAANAYIPQDPEDNIGRVEATYNKLLEVESDFEAFYKADLKGKLEGDTLRAKVENAAAQGIIPNDKVEAILEYDEMRYDCLLTDAFDKEFKEVQMHTERPI